MSELLPTQDITDCPVNEDDSQPKEKPWGRLLPLTKIFTSIDMFKDMYSFGREDVCDFRFLPNMFDVNAHFLAISKMHFRITRELTAQGLLVFIHDLSSNGTFLNEHKIGKGKKQPLNNNDEISVALRTCKCFIFSDLLSVQEGFPSSVTLKYTISRLLGRGACGEVRLVFDKQSCQKHAMKIVQKKNFSFLSKAGDSLIDRVESEVSILMKLNHPCIVQIFDVINTEEALYMILELVEYGELFDRVVQLGQLTELDCKFLFLQIVLATKYLHDNGITHRDLKPENILLSGPSNRCLIKVTDFGLSKFVDGNTMLRTFCGTPTYLAPEVLLTAGAGVYTSSIDVWSLGVILYICLVGYPPFTDERKDYELQQQIIGGHFDFPTRFWAGISESVKDLISKLLTVDPINRISLENALSHPWLDDEDVKLQLSDLLTSSGFKFLDCNLNGALPSASPSIQTNLFPSVGDFATVLMNESSTDGTTNDVPLPSSKHNYSYALDNQPLVGKRLLIDTPCLVPEKKQCIIPTSAFSI